MNFKLLFITFNLMDYLKLINHFFIVDLYKDCLNFNFIVNYYFIIIDYCIDLKMDINYFIINYYLIIIN